MVFEGKNWGAKKIVGKLSWRCVGSIMARVIKIAIWLGHPRFSLSLPTKKSKIHVEEMFENIN